MGDLADRRTHGRRQSTVEQMSIASGSLAAPMQLYVERLLPTCRIVWLYMLQHNLAHELIDVDFSSAEGYSDFKRKHAHKEVPLLVDGGVVIFTAPAILSYLATQYTDYSGFGLTLESRFIVESLVSWANSELHRCAGFRVAYPSCLDKYRLSTDAGTEELVEHGMRRLAKHIEGLESEYLHTKNYLTGDRPTIADSFVATVLLQAQWNGFRFQMWPRVERWLQRVRAQEFWSDVHRVHNDLVRDLDKTPFQFD